MAYLVVKWRGNEIHRAELAGAITIGREIGVNVWINDPALSRRHCMIEAAPDGRWWAIDLHSHNGIFIKGKQIDRRVLCDGDCIRLGDAEATFHEGAFQPRRAATPEDAMFESHMEPPERPAAPVVLPLGAATISRATDSPIKPAEVHLLPAPDEPIVQPYALPFQRPAPRVNFPPPETLATPAQKEPAAGRSRPGTIHSLLRKLRLI